jgi:hypothetical protein
VYLVSSLCKYLWINKVRLQNKKIPATELFLAATLSLHILEILLYNWVAHTNVKRCILCCMWRHFQQLLLNFPVGNSSHSQHVFDSRYWNNSRANEHESRVLFSKVTTAWNMRYYAAELIIGYVWIRSLPREILWSRECSQQGINVTRNNLRVSTLFLSQVLSTIADVSISGPV